MVRGWRYDNRRGVACHAPVPLLYYYWMKENMRRVTNVNRRHIQIAHKMDPISRRQFMKTVLVTGLALEPILTNQSLGEASIIRMQTTEVSSLNIVSKHTAVFTQPPHNTPTNLMPDGPLLGNGDVGVTLSGPPENQSFHIGKNDFWQTVDPEVITVGALQIAFPLLNGASYHQEQDIAHGEVRGVFATNDISVAMRTWIADTENLMVTEITTHGANSCFADINYDIRQSIRENDNHVDIGREQFNGGRWYFDGILDDVRIYNRALTLQEIRKLASGSPPTRGLELSWPENAHSNARVTDGSPVQGKTGETIRFDGKGAFVDLGPLHLANELTISAWVYTSGFSNEANYIVSKGEWSKAYSLGLSDGYIRMAVGDQYVQTTFRIDMNRWRLVTGTYNGAQIAIYVDGVEVASNNNRVTNWECDAKSALITFSERANAHRSSSGRSVTVATCVIGARSVVRDGQSLQFELSGGRPAYLVTSILSDLNAKDHQAAARKRAESITLGEITHLYQTHLKWWGKFWSKSFIEIPDKLIEKHWYGALYILGCCSRPGKIAPGLWGNWLTTDTPAWHGDYTLNYNFEAPYYIVYSSNHADLADPYYAAINSFMPMGREMAKTHGWKGVHYPTHIGPWELMTEGWQDWGQRSDAAYAALDYITHYDYTQDIKWLKTIGYPFLREVATFWENYLRYENGRYVDYDDSIHEGSGPDMNGVLSLGLIHTLFKAMLRFSSALNVDADKRDKWRHILANLSDYPLQERNGKTVFRYTEKGMAWNDGNDLGVQHIFPAGAIGLDSDPKLLHISRNMVEEMARWVDGNAFSSFYTAAVRVGYDPTTILQHLKDQCATHAYPNLILFYGGGGIETCGGFLALNEMLLQSYDGVLRLFPVWPEKLDAKFGNLRAYGAFLVSAELKNGMVTNLELFSEKGEDCTMQNPWAGKAVRVLHGGNKAERRQGDRFTFKTRKGESVKLIPA